MIFDFKRRFTKYFSVLLAAVLLCGLTGCDSNISVPGESNVVFEPFPVPEDGWTAESLSKTIRINGKELPEPFTCEGLGEGYNIKIDNGYPYLYFNKKCIATVRYKDFSHEADNSKELDCIGVFKENHKYGSLVLINGVRLGSTCEEAGTALGKPTVEYEIDDRFIWDYSENNYDDEEYFLVLHFDKSDDTIMWIAFYL